MPDGTAQIQLRPDQWRARALLPVLRGRRAGVFLGCGLRRGADEPDGFAGFTDFNGRAGELDAVVDDFADGAPSSERFSCLSTRAVPPTATSSGHSTNPATPRAPKVSAAAGVEWLPVLKPRCAPLAAPFTPPITPLIAAPPTAPAASVVIVAARVAAPATFRTVPATAFMGIPCPSNEAKWLT